MNLVKRSLLLCMGLLLLLLLLQGAQSLWQVKRLGDDTQEVITITRLSADAQLLWTRFTEADRALRLRTQDPHLGGGLEVRHGGGHVDGRAQTVAQHDAEAVVRFEVARGLAAREPHPGACKVLLDPLAAQIHLADHARRRAGMREQAQYTLNLGRAIADADAMPRWREGDPFGAVKR